jgi:arylsulfatase A-like enzyme
LKRFAQDAILYRNAFSSGDMTLLTHASLFTGLYSLRHGAHYKRGLPMACAPLDASRETLAEILSNQGYDTAGIVANTAFLSDAFGMAQGFSFYDQRAASPTLGRVTREYSLRYFVREFLIRFSIPREYDQVTRRAEDVNATVFNQLDRLKQGNRPFFLFVNYMDAHTPYVPPPPYDTKFPGKIEGYNAAHYDELTDKVMLHGMPVPEAERRHLLSQYDGGIAYIDEHLGKLFDRLRQSGLYDNSLIVVTSDHGEAFGERNQLEHWGISVYNNLVHVPWIVRYPASMGREHGIVKDEIVSSVDLMPTVLEVLGYPIPKQVEGMSLLAGHPQDRAVFSESYPRYSLTSIKKWRRIERAVVSGNCELYDLSADPGESRNLCSQEEKVSRELIGMVKKWVGKGESGPATGPVTGMPDRGTMDSLKSLGYVQ